MQKTYLIGGFAAFALLAACATQAEQATVDDSGGAQAASVQTDQTDTTEQEPATAITEPAEESVAMAEPTEEPAVSTGPVVFEGEWGQFGPEYPFTLTVKGDRLVYKDGFTGGCSFSVPINERGEAVIKTGQYDGCRSGGRTYNNIYITVNQPTADGGCSSIVWESFDGRGEYRARGTCTSG